MNTKVCSKCGEVKDIELFHKNKSYKDGISNVCEECHIKIRKEKDKKRIDRYRNKNREKIREKDREYIKNNKDIIRERNVKYYYKNKEKEIERVRKYQENNKEKIVNKRNIYCKEKYDNDILYKLQVNVRNRVRAFFKSIEMAKNNSTFDIVGCTPEELKIYIESLFIEGMNWENHGIYGWHIDHIIPLSSAKTEEEIYKLCHYTNLQPLWATDNYKKGDNYKKED